MQTYVILILDIKKNVQIENKINTYFRKMAYIVLNFWEILVIVPNSVCFIKLFKKYISVCSIHNIYIKSRNGSTTSIYRITVAVLIVVPNQW